MFKIIFKFCIIFLLFSSALQSKNYNNILINGNERISDQTILVFSELPEEKFLDESATNLILKKLYQSGFFKDVSVKIENNILSINVIENPIIQFVSIEGIKKKNTKESLNKNLSLKDRSSFDSTLVRKDENIILNFLKNEGYFFSTVTSSIEELGDNKINLFYNIILGEKAKISKISFIGDKKFKDGTLQNVIVSEEYKFWKFLSGKKYLNQKLINLDEKLLKNYFKNKGFYNVNVESSFANYLGNDKFEILFNISSGKKYYFNDLIIKLPSNYDVDDFNKLNIMLADLKNEEYSLNSIDKILDEIDKIVLKEKYDFLKANVTENINDNLINLTFNIGESESFYVEKINIYGNNITQEEVLRNTFSVDEGDAFNELLYKKTVNNLKSLNFFNNVDSKVVDGTLKNQKIINITVEEKPTGEISAGAGVGSTGGTVAFGIKENNFLGKGIRFGSDVSVSSETVKGLVSLNNPNFKGSNRSLNVSAESSVVDRLKTFGYESNKMGISVGSGYEFYEDINLNMGISSFVEKLETDNSASASLKKQKGSYFDTFLNYTFDYDKRNQRFQPSDGFRSRFTQNVPLISENYSLTNTYNFQFYDELFAQNITSYGFYASTTNSLTGDDVKLSDRLFLPSSKLRGFETGKVGPKDGSDYIGGNYALAFNASTTLPQILPSFQNSSFSLFFDAANIWGVDYSSTIDEDSSVRSSIGLAVDFFTPIGPLNFSLSEPITKGKNDITETFRFNLGTTF